jgi:hypothetical protein
MIASPISRSGAIILSPASRLPMQAAPSVSSGRVPWPATLSPRAREPDHRGDIIRALDERNRTGMLVSREVPGLASLLLIGVLRGCDTASDGELLEGIHAGEPMGIGWCRGRG